MLYQIRCFHCQYIKQISSMLKDKQFLKQYLEGRLDEAPF